MRIVSIDIQKFISFLPEPYRSRYLNLPYKYQELSALGNVKTTDVLNHPFVKTVVEFDDSQLLTTLFLYEKANPKETLLTYYVGSRNN